MVEEDHYLTIINAAGLINLDKMYQAQDVMDHIAVFHQHFFNRGRIQCTSVDRYVFFFFNMPKYLHFPLNLLLIFKVFRQFPQNCPNIISKYS